MWLAPFRANAAPVRGASRIRIRACSAGAAFTPNFPAPWPRPKEGRKKALIVVSHPNVGKSFNHSLDLVDWCDIVIHQFPIYWWSVPAIHKGLMDRTLVYHYSYPPHASKWSGKQWMCSVTVGPD